GDLDGDGFVEFHRRSKHGLEVQSWKDSHDSQRFHDGTVAKSPIAACEVQGYVYDAKRRIAELARDVWRDRDLPSRLHPEAGSTRKLASCNGSSTRPSGARSAEATTRSPWTPRSARSTRCARTSAISSGAGSCRRAASTPSSTR